MVSNLMAKTLFRQFKTVKPFDLSDRVWALFKPFNPVRENKPESFNRIYLEH